MFPTKGVESIVAGANESEAECGDEEGRGEELAGEAGRADLLPVRRSSQPQPTAHTRYSHHS